jgi:predicted nucleic acid-binding protein
MDKRFFFDSYAIIEGIKGNPNYDNYKDAGMVITKLNLFEVCYFLLRDFSEDKAIDFMENLSDCVVDFDSEIILIATKLKLSRKEDALSMVDCIGYVLSKSLNIKFLTGDKKFKDMENVEYVK